MFECTRNRSRFWIRIHSHDDDSINISASTITKQLICYEFPHLELNSPRGWRPSANRQGLYNLWLPQGCYDQEDVSTLESWAISMNQFIWLGTNRNTEPFFSGSEIDFCLANDWNFNFETHSRTVVGDAEYSLKYRNRYLSTEDRKKHVITLANAVQECVSALPVPLDEYVVTTIPAPSKDQLKLAWPMSKFIAKENGLPFCGVTLLKDKPQMKTLSLENKITTWRTIYSDPQWIEIPEDLRGKKVLIVDDLFQSGASLFCFAEYLKNQLGVKQTIAITSVKALKDGDNT